MRLALLTSVFALACATTDSDAPREAAWQAQLAEATSLFESGDVAGAAQLAEAALASARDDVEPGDDELVGPLLLVSSLRLLQGRFNEAEPVAAEAHALTEDALVAARTRVATTLKYLGVIYAQQARLDDAERVHRRALEVSTESVGPDDPETAKHVGNLGALLLQRGRLEEAEALLRRALDIWRGADGLHAVYGAGAMMNLGEVCMASGRTDEGLALYREGVAIQEGAFGDADPRVVNTRRRFAGALRRAGLEDEAAAVEAR